jgi:hypothetical protein
MPETIAVESHEEYQRRGLSEWPDVEVVRAVSDVVAVPRAAPADSFVLHAPLELLARAELLRHVRPGGREQARRELFALAARYASAGDPVDEPAACAFRSLGAAADGLVDAIARGELDDVDRIAAWLAAHASGSDIRRLLSARVVRSLAAAAHAGILLYLLPRGDLGAAPLRGVVRELAREAAWRLTWFDDLPRHADDDAPRLLDALCEVPPLGVPGSTFIYPLMDQVERTGVAAALLGPVVAAGVEPADARRVLQRFAAWSMVTEPDDYVPYGWTHCLTMPQAVINLAGDGLDPREAIAVAATYVVGFRAALGQRRVVPTAAPVIAPDQAATRWSAVATAASHHEDAHFVKYTLACIHAATTDPDYGALYLAAAERLARWWQHHEE